MQMGVKWKALLYRLVQNVSSLYRVIVMVMMFKRQSNRHVLYTRSSPDITDTDRLLTSDPNYYTSQKATEERRDAERKGTDYLDTRQDHSHDETGM